MAQVNFKLNDHIDSLWCFVTTLGKFDLILGIPWLEQRDPSVSFKSRSLKFKSDYCMSNCLLHGKLTTVHSDRGQEVHRIPKDKPSYDVAEISAYAFLAMVNRTQNQTIAMWLKHFEQLKYPKEEDIRMLTSAFTTDIAAVTAEDYDKFFDKMRKAPIARKDLLKIVPSEYHDYIDVWNPVEANKLPPPQPIDHHVDLIDGAISPAKRAYGLSQEQATVVKEYVNEMLGKGYIQLSTSPYAAPVLIVKKPDGGLRVCVDYRALNALIIKNRNVLPLIRETLSWLCKAKLYSKFDIIAAFNEVRIKEGHEEKTAFLTRYRLFEYLVMPFGLCNAPGTFQAFINETLREYLDILIYSSSKEEHTEHVRKVLYNLQKAGLYLDVWKYDFSVTEVKYLGLIITTEGLKMDLKKNDTILNWKVPRCIKDIQAFLEFANFYQRFIAGYSSITVPLTALTKETTKASRSHGTTSVLNNDHLIHLGKPLPPPRSWPISIQIRRLGWRQMPLTMW